MAKLTPKQKIFVDEYLIDLNATQAAIRAGYSPKTARQIAEQNLSKLDIQNAISQAMQDRAERTGISQDEVLRYWQDMATVDYNEISQLRRVNCRYCWVKDHAYQYTPKEYEKAEREGQVNEDDIGGFDFKHHREPNPNCPECGGVGYERVYLNDSTKLSDKAKNVYLGVKQTKFGVEVMTTDRVKILEMFARHLGMFNDKLSIDATMKAEVASLSNLIDELSNN